MYKEIDIPFYEIIILPVSQPILSLMLTFLFKSLCVMVDNGWRRSGDAQEGGKVGGGEDGS